MGKKKTSVSKVTEEKGTKVLWELMDFVCGKKKKQKTKQKELKR
jgi:hypothetical protein